MNYNRPIVLSIAGFDPSGGAGVLADVKTLEQLHCLGMAVITANTNQTENKFFDNNWVALELIKNQSATLLQQYKIDVVKIGIINNLKVLHELVLGLKEINAHLKIIWDTVLAASTGFSFLENIDKALLEKVLPELYLITPNFLEIKTIANIDDANFAQQYLAQFTNVLLKGGHNENNKGTDVLLTKDNVKTIIAPNNNLTFYPKHGTGCILSAAIAAYLALGKPLTEACAQAKMYVATIANSNPNLLAYHNV